METCETIWNKWRAPWLFLPRMIKKGLGWCLHWLTRSKGEGAVWVWFGLLRFVFTIVVLKKLNAFGTCASYLTPFVNFLSYTRTPHLPKQMFFPHILPLKTGLISLVPILKKKRTFSLSHTIPRPPHPLVPQNMFSSYFFCRKVVGLLGHFTTIIIWLCRKCNGKASIARITLEHLIINTWTYLHDHNTNQ